MSESDPTQIRAHLERVLHSPPFARAPRMQRFLQFLVEETLQGRASQLKEYTIAVDVFGKSIDFEPGTSPVVRVEAGRLRKLLLQYRVEHGADDVIVFEVPKGSYVPTFFRRPEIKPTGTGEAPDLQQSIGQRDAQLPPAWAPPEERRLVTVVSCAWGDDRPIHASGVGKTFLSTFDAFHQTCIGVAQRHGGTVDGGASDRLMIYFGWPNALEDAAGRALTAALEMLTAIQSSAGTAAHGIRIAVASSEVVTRASAAGDTLARPAVVGEAPGLATRVLQKVPLNGILVTEATRRLTGALFDFIQAGSLQEGGGEPNLLWRLLRNKPVLTRFRASHGDSQTSIVGRKEEAALLMSRWRLSLEGEGQAILIVGDAGIGKSRLAESVLDQVRREGVAIRAQCSSHHVNSTLYPFIELLKHQINLVPDEGAELAAVLDGFLARFGFSDRLDRALLGSLLAQAQDDTLNSLSASQQKDLTLKLLTRLLRAQVERQPTILLVEDVHWADPTSLELLQDILRLCADIRLMALLTSRQDSPNCTQQASVTSIRLSRLPKKDCNALIDRMVSAAPLSATARALILEKAEGIPLFLEELTKLFLAADEHRFKEPPVPESLSDLLASQLDRLGPTRSVAQIAAVIGRQFSGEMLALASGHAQEEIDTALDQLLAAGIIVREGVEASQVFSFRHALLRDAAYGSILDESRRELHHRVGSLLVESFPGIAMEHPEVIARHMMDAGDYNEAVPFWIDAGHKASRRYALAEAITDFRLALDALTALPDGLPNRERQLEVLIDLGLVIRHARGYGDQELASIYEKARALAAELGQQEQLANAVYGLWTHAAGRGRWKTAVTLANEFQGLCGKSGQGCQMEVEAFRLLGASAAFRGEFAIAAGHFNQALAKYDADRHGPRFGFDPGAVSAAYLSWTVWHLGRYEEARHYAARALSLAEAKGHASTLAMVLSWLMFHAVCDKDAQAVIRYNGRLQVVCTERDCRYWQPFGAACSEWAAFESDGDVRHLDRLTDFTNQFRERYFTSCLLLLAADICHRLKRPEQGLAIVATASRFIEDHDERVWEAECARLEAELHMQTNCPSPERARKLLQDAIEICHRQKARSLQARAQGSLAQLEAI